MWKFLLLVGKLVNFKNNKITKSVISPRLPWHPFTKDKFLTLQGLQCALKQTLPSATDPLLQVVRRNLYSGNLHNTLINDCNQQNEGFDKDAN